MKHIEDVLEDIKQIDGPSGKLRDRILDAYDGYEYNGVSEISIDRYIKEDTMNAKAYRIGANYPGSPKIIALIDDGKDHYVSTVIDAHIKE